MTRMWILTYRLLCHPCAHEKGLGVVLGSIPVGSSCLTNVVNVYPLDVNIENKWYVEINGTAYGYDANSSYQFRWISKYIRFRPLIWGNILMLKNRSIDVRCLLVIIWVVRKNECYSFQLGSVSNNNWIFFMSIMTTWVYCFKALNP